MGKNSKVKQVIGRKEKISFPDIGISDIEAKIDTGAYTSALHCHDLSVVSINGKSVFQFKILDPSHAEYVPKIHSFYEYEQKEIKNSFGDSEVRFIIKTRIRIGKKLIKTSISLSDRAAMRFPVLIGRKLLKNRFIVDVSEEDLLNKK